jgi:hypothetical protein
MSADTNQDSALATVAKVIDDYKLVINRGLEHGVREGSRFLIYGIGEEIIDPETNESLGELELVRGIGIVTNVQKRMSTVVSTKTKAPAPTIRTTKRNSRGVAASFFGHVHGDEIVEERKGEPIPVAFSGAKEGDRARPL